MAIELPTDVELPMDIIWTILAKCPAELICQCKLMNKPIKKMIETPEFARSVVHALKEDVRQLSFICVPRQYKSGSQVRFCIFSAQELFASIFKPSHQINSSPLIIEIPPSTHDDGLSILSLYSSLDGHVLFGLESSYSQFTGYSKRRIFLLDLEHSSLLEIEKVPRDVLKKDKLVLGHDKQGEMIVIGINESESRLRISTCHGGNEWSCERIYDTMWRSFYIHKADSNAPFYLKGHIYWQLNIKQASGRQQSHYLMRWELSTSKFLIDWKTPKSFASFHTVHLGQDQTLGMHSSTQIALISEEDVLVWKHVKLQPEPLLYLKSAKLLVSQSDGMLCLHVLEGKSLRAGPILEPMTSLGDVYSGVFYGVRYSHVSGQEAPVRDI